MLLPSDQGLAASWWVPCHLGLLQIYTGHSIPFCLLSGSCIDQQELGDSQQVYLVTLQVRCKHLPVGRFCSIVILHGPFLMTGSPWRLKLSISSSQSHQPCQLDSNGQTSCGWVLPRKLSMYSSRVELGSTVGSSGVSIGIFWKVNQLFTDLQNNWKSSYCSMVFQSKDGVMSDIDGWFSRSFTITAVRAAIGSAGSRGGMAEGVQRRLFWGHWRKQSLRELSCSVVSYPLGSFIWNCDTILLGHWGCV